MIGAVGEEWYPDMENAVEALCSYRPTCTATEEPQIKRKICIIQENLHRSEKRF